MKVRPVFHFLTPVILSEATQERSRRIFALAKLYAWPMVRRSFDSGLTPLAQDDRVYIVYITFS